MQMTHLVKKGTAGTLELFGPIVEFLTPPTEADAMYCVMLAAGETSGYTNPPRGRQQRLPNATPSLFAN